MFLLQPLAQFNMYSYPNSGRPWKNCFLLTNDMILSSLEDRKWKGTTFPGSRFNLKTLKVPLNEVCTQACRLWLDKARWKLPEGEACKEICFSWISNNSLHPNTFEHEKHLKFPFILWIFRIWPGRLNEEERFWLSEPQTNFRSCNVGSLLCFWRICWYKVRFNVKTF